FQVQDSGSTAAVTGSGLSANGLNTSAATYTMNVNVLPVADAPTAVAAPKTTILEDNSYTFGTADFAFTDSNDTGSLKGSPVHPAGTGDQLKNILITVAPTSGTLKDGGITINSGNVPFAVSANDLATGKL